MRFKTALLMAMAAGAAMTNGDGTPMVQAQKPAASLAVSRAGGDGLDVSIVANGGGITYFGGVFLEFGDGDRQLICRGGEGCRETRTAHRYKQPGTFQVRMVGLGEPDQKPLAVVTVAVPMK